MKIYREVTPRKREREVPINHISINISEEKIAELEDELKASKEKIQFLENEMVKAFRRIGQFPGNNIADWLRRQKEHAQSQIVKAIGIEKFKTLLKLSRRHDISIVYTWEQRGIDFYRLYEDIKEK